MGLQEATTGKRLSAKKLAESEHVNEARARLPARTFEKICKTLDEAIDELVDRKSTRFVWMNTGSLVGDRADMSHAAHQHLWEAVFKLFPKETDPVATKHRRITVGALIKWRVALRSEDWLVYPRETTKTDIVSGDTIYANEYWIKGEDVVVTLTSPKSSTSSRASVDDLKNKFNKR